MQKVMEIAPAGEIMGKSYADVFREAGFFTGEAEGRASFQIGEHRIEIESRVVKETGILRILNYIYRPCEVIVRVDGMVVLERRFF